MEMLPFITKDIYVASYLITLGYKYELEQDNTHYNFVFKNDENSTIENLVEAYWEGDTAIDAKSLFSAFKELKTRIFGSRS